MRRLGKKRFGKTVPENDCSSLKDLGEHAEAQEFACNAGKTAEASLSPAVRIFEPDPGYADIRLFLHECDSERQRAGIQDRIRVNEHGILARRQGETGIDSAGESEIFREIEIGYARIFPVSGRDLIDRTVIDQYRADFELRQAVQRRAHRPHGHRGRVVIDYDRIGCSPFSHKICLKILPGGRPPELRGFRASLGTTRK